MITSYYPCALRHVGHFLLVISLWLSGTLCLCADDSEMFHANDTDRRFLVIGFSQEINLTLLRWAGEATRQLESFLKRKLPFNKGKPLVIRVFSAGPQRPVGVSSRQRWSDAGLDQELHITGFGAADQEDMLEALYALLLARALNGTERPKTATNIDDLQNAPAWFTVGAAQAINASTRERNREFIRRQISEGSRPVHGVLQMVGSVTLPPGRWRIKAACGAFVGWLGERSDMDRVVNGLLTQWKTNPITSTDWLVALFPGAHTLRDLEKLWALRLLEWSERATPGSPDMQGAGRGIDAVLQFRPAELLPARPELPNDQRPLALLTDLAEETWYPELIASLRTRFTALQAGQSREFQHVVSLHLDWLDRAATLHKAASASVPRSVLTRRAEEAYDIARNADRRWRERVATLSAYLDYFEKQKEATVPTSSELPPTLIQRYIDQFDPASPRNSEEENHNETPAQSPAPAPAPAHAKAIRTNYTWMENL